MKLRRETWGLSKGTSGHLEQLVDRVGSMDNVFHIPLVAWKDQENPYNKYMDMKLVLPQEFWLF